ncbi:MAG: hypothetical protein COB76_03070 [Alphaproteobacteria bacterium]|nr:MAG: hypothetical protein COB76_03070 [Alphaproteobacteria bacterium]
MTDLKRVEILIENWIHYRLRPYLTARTFQDQGQYVDALKSMDDVSPSDFLNDFDRIPEDEVCDDRRALSKRQKKLFTDHGLTKQSFIQMYNAVSFAACDENVSKADVADNEIDEVFFVGRAMSSVRGVFGDVSQKKSEHILCELGIRQRTQSTFISKQRRVNL